ncbi:MAG: DNA topoisomerase III [Gammaproteobacteria bacterium WSBS_2016_MAG_OTU1]
MAPTQGKTLVIAEKPSVAGDIARALGGMKRLKDFYESDTYLVSSAVGHLVEMSAPEGVEVKRGKWNLSNLPVLPEHNNFKLSPIKASEARLKTLATLYKRADVSDIINACDAGREGELIFYNLMGFFKQNIKSKSVQDRPVRRLWLSSMTPAAIRAGFGKLRDNNEMVPLQQAAVCRAEADWLVGINSTRAITALHSSGGGFTLTTVGRVQTPTLAILVDREQQIKEFISRDYWEVRALFAAAAGNYEGRWIDLAVEKARKKDKNDSKAEEKYPERIFEHAQAQKILADCAGGVGEATEKKKPSSEIAPPLFDLTSLQREANARFGLPARATLGAAQALYERHKMITYPRTDSKALPEDYPAVVAKTLSILSADGEFGVYAKNILQQNWINSANKRIFNNSKVSDHFAIVPTGEIKTALKDIESKIYRLILMRFLSVFYPPAKYENTERRTVVADHTFLTKGRILVSAGWREIGARVPKDAEIVPITEGEKITVDEINEEQKRTMPQPRYNEATLLSAMEGAGKFVEDEELREAMRERGMGTPATRASIIEGLVKERYVLRDGRELLPTPKAQSLMRLLRALKVEDLTLPSMTGNWEYKLRRIEQADFDHTTFIGEIRDLTKRIVLAAQQCGEVESVEGDYATLNSKCPACGGEVRESHRRFSCQKCEFFIWKAVAGREFSVGEIETLLAGEKTAELEGFRSKLGREFSAEMVLRKDEAGVWRTVFDFGNDASELSGEEMSQKESVGNCPKCGALVRDIGNAFVCENKNSNSCDFGMARRLLQREMKAEEISALINSGETDFLEGFISKKTRRPFVAKLVMDLTSKDGKLMFEFKPSTRFKNSSKGSAKTATKPAAKKAAKKPAKKATKKAAKKAAKK